MVEEQLPVRERGVLSVPDVVWDLAVARAQVIGPLAESDVLGGAAVEAAAVELELSRRQVYELVRRWRSGEGAVSDLVPGRSSGGRGGEQLPEDVEAVIRDVLRRQYLTRQRKSVAAVHREIVRVCRSQGLRVPSRGSVVRRIGRLDPLEGSRRRDGADAARGLEAAGGVPPEVAGVLEQVQVDHTVVDLVVVDERHRLPIGRPYVTAAIDVYSRCLVGLVVTLEAPSATSVGLCLAHTVTDKRAWLERVDVQASWPMSGKPRELFVDNAAEFHGEALRRGCEQHGIGLRFRPPGRPHYGGVVERVIGTMMRMVHELPGTTFSNPAQRGGYDSDATACLTLKELQQWLALAVAGYHGQVHTGTGQTPAARWAEGIGHAGPGGRGGTPVTVSNESAFLVDFLPVLRRRLTRSGFVLDHVHYFSDALKPWIARRDRLDRFVIRRDPRDISRIWVLDPAGQFYVEVPYRTLSYPPVSLWEQQAAAARLREQGRAQVDEQALFRMVEQMRSITDTAAATTRKARRAVARRADVEVSDRRDVVAASPPPDSPPIDVDDLDVVVAPFDVIEQW